MFIHISNVLTLSRIVLTPISLALFHFENLFIKKIALAIFIFSCFTDFLDGYYDRKYKLTSPFGSKLDQLADKWLSLSFLAFLIAQKQIENFSVILYYLILFREMLIMAIRNLYPEINLTSSNLGKFKTFFLDFGITLMLIDLCQIANFKIYALACITISTILAIVSGIFYCYQTWKELNEH